MTISGVRRNMLANAGFIAPQLALMMIFTRLLLGTLGPAMYGLIPPRRSVRGSREAVAAP